MGLFGKKESKKFGDSKTLVTPEGLTEGSISWKQLSLTAVDGVANTWFAEYDLKPITQCLPPGAVDADEHVQNFARDFANYLVSEDQPLSIPGLEIDPDDLGEQIDITDGTLGPAIVAALESAGLIWRYETMFPISHAESVELPDDKTLGLSQWQTYFGVPFEQMFRIYRNAEGKETCLWSSKVLAATRPFEHITTRQLYVQSEDETYVAEISPEAIAKGALTFGQWSTKLFIPAVAKRLFFLAETPFPSTVIMSFSRDIAFGEEVAKENYPRPVLVSTPQTHARAAFDFQDGGGFLASGTIMPHVVEMGWTFDTTNQAEIIKILTVITEGLTRINSILEDGYLNYRTDDYPYPYDDVLLSAAKFDASYIQGEDALAMSIWVPVPRLGILLNETNVRSGVAVGQNNVDEQYWVSLNGAGMFVPNAINSLVYSTLIEEQEWFTIDRLLDASVRMNVKDESTNSLANWGIAKFKEGLVDEAIEKFELALARPDKYSEGEASYWLAEIWEQRGDAAEAQAFRDRCKAAGGYVPGAGFSPSGGPSTPPVQTGGGLSKSSDGGTGLSKSSGGGLGGGGAGFAALAGAGQQRQFQGHIAG
jgi:hypothetical protein